MSTDNGNFLPVPSGGELEPATLSGPPASGRHTQEPLRKLLSVMRGRWPLAIVLSLILALVVGAVGYGVGRHSLRYTSTGIVRVMATQPRTLSTSKLPENDPTRNFELIINTQVQKIQQPRILLAASNHPDVRKFDHTGYPDLVAYLKDHLQVHRGEKDELIWVDFTDRDPTVAHKACTAIVKAYMDLEAEHDSKSTDKRREDLERNRKYYREALLDDNRQRDEVTARFGTRELKLLHSERLKKSLDYEGRLEALRSQLRFAGIDVADLEKAAVAAVQSQTRAAAGPQAPTPADGAPKASPSPESQPQPDNPQVEALVPQDVAQFDDRTKRLLLELEAAQTELTRLETQFGPAHREVKAAHHLIAKIEKDLAQRMKELRDKGVQTAVGSESLLSVDKLKAQFMEALGLYQATKKDMDDLFAAIAKVDRIDRDIASTQQVLATIEHDLEDLKIEQGSIHRIDLSNEPELPTEPSVESRRQGRLLTAGGTLLGGGLGLAIIFLIGVIDRRLRSLDDAHETFASTPVLGILPTLLRDMSDPDQATLASHCVHQIRTLLQIGPESQGRRVFTVTSPSPQDGKTSMVLSLGVSFSASGAKTLLIDCDLGFGGLSHRLDASVHRKLGQLLMDEGFIDELRLIHALQVSHKSGQKLGQTLVDCGDLTEEELQSTLRKQEETRIGLLEAIGGEPLENCVVRTKIQDLSILPIGAANAQHVARLSPGTIRRLLEQARAQFDVVLIDTGSVLGSLEASHMAVESDGVIIVMSRGGRRDLAEQAISHLYALGARVAGIVFNRAAGRDVEIVAERSVSSIRPIPAPGENGRPKGAGRMGPLAGAVVSSAWGEEPWRS